jgi:3-oxoacyl-[acyl-carrier protein] reductase
VSFDPSNEGRASGRWAYAASKGALAAVTLTLADELADRVRWIRDERIRSCWVANRLPAGRWGQPDDPVRLIAWLVSDDGAWMTRQVLNTEGGFRRWANLAGGGDPRTQRGDR